MQRLAFHCIYRWTKTNNTQTHNTQRTLTQEGLLHISHKTACVIGILLMIIYTSVKPETALYTVASKVSVLPLVQSLLYMRLWVAILHKAAQLFSLENG